MTVENSFQSIPVAFQTGDGVISFLKWGFICGLALFICCLPFLRSRHSFFDVFAVRKVLKLLRCMILLEIACLCLLLYFYITYGNPIQLHAALSYGNGESWIYGYARPVSGIILLSFGFFGEMHPGTRFLCIIGCLLEGMGDAISAYQVHDYSNQMQKESAPSNGLSSLAWQTYLWRDIISFALCTVNLFLVLHLMCILGFCLPQFIHHSQISGDDYDRYGVMHRLRSERKVMAEVGLVESQSSFATYWKGLQKKKDKVEVESYV